MYEPVPIGVDPPPESKRPYPVKRVIRYIPHTVADRWKRIALLSWAVAFVGWLSFVVSLMARN